MDQKRNYSVISVAKRVPSIFAAFCFLLITACVILSQQKSLAEEPKDLTLNKPTVTVSPAVAEYKPGVEVLISGSGFEPRQKLKLKIIMAGVSSGIHFMVKPQPLPNDLGAFAGVWKLKREISRKLIQPAPMVYTLAVTDELGNTLCTAPLVFCDPKAQEKSPICTFMK